MRVKIVEVDDGAEMEEASSSTGRIVEVEEGDAVETCFICDRTAMVKEAKLETEEDYEVARYCCEEHEEMHHPDRDVDAEPFPFGVRYKKDCGRHIVAARHEVLFEL